jgi:hypothetical protein
MSTTHPSRAIERMQCFMRLLSSEANEHMILISCSPNCLHNVHSKRAVQASGTQAYVKVTGIISLRASFFAKDNAFSPEYEDMTATQLSL